MDVFNFLKCCKVQTDPTLCNTFVCLNLLPACVFQYRQPCIFPMGKNVLSTAKHFSLFLPCNMAAVQNLYFPTTCVLHIQNRRFQIPIQSWNAQVFLSAISISAGMDLAKSFALLVALNKVVTVRLLHQTHFKTDATDNREMAY